MYYSKLSPEKLLKESFDLRKLNYFKKKNNLPKIEKAGVIICRKEYEKQNGIQKLKEHNKLK